MQPGYVPISSTEKIRPVRRLPAPRQWVPNRPSDLASGPFPVGSALGTPGPDQGYAYQLVDRFDGKLILADEEHEHDAKAGSVAVALGRASLFGRSPVIYDIEAAMLLWGFLGDPPADLIDYRKSLFRGAAEDYWCRRRIAASVPESALRLSPQMLRGRQKEWRAVLGI